MSITVNVFLFLDFLKYICSLLQRIVATVVELTPKFRDNKMYFLCRENIKREYIKNEREKGA